MLKLITRRNCHFDIKDNTQRSINVCTNYKMAKKNHCCLETNSERIEFSRRQNCENENCNKIVRVNKNNDFYNSLERWNAVCYFLLVTGIMGYLLINNKASANAEENENIKDDNGLQFPEKLDELSIKLTQGLPAPIENYLDFQGKKELLDERLKSQSIVVISGAGGMGKSTLAVQYAHECKQGGGMQVIWVKGTQIEEEFFRLASFLEIEISSFDNEFIETSVLNSEIIRNLVYGHLQMLFDKRPLLFIFDNVETTEKIEKYLINLPNTAKVIITARNGDLLDGIKPFRVKGFREEEAAFYLRQILKISEEEAKKIVKVVGESPFRLSMIAAYVKNYPSRSVDELTKKYLQIKKGHSLDETIYPEVEMLFRNLKKDSPSGWELLKYLAYLDAEGVSVPLIGKIMDQTVNELEEAINKLREMSLVKANERKVKVTHRIVQEETRKALNEEDKSQNQKILEKLIHEINQVFPNVNSNPENWKKVMEIVSHAKMLIEEAKEIDQATPGRASLLSKIVTYFFYINFNYKEAINYWEELLKHQMNIHTEGHPKVARLLNSVGIAYCRLGGAENVKKGLQYFEASLKMRQELYPSNHLDVAGSLNNVGRAYEDLGGTENMERGLQYFEASLKMKQELYPGNHPDVAISLHHIGRAYEDLGGIENMKKGLQYLEASLKMSKELLYSGNHPERAKSLNIVGLAYINLKGAKNTKKGLQYFEASLKMNQELYSGNHPMVAKSLNNVGRAYKDLGGAENMKRGLQYLKASLKMWQALYPSNHPAVAESLNTVGLVYKDLQGAKNIKKGLQYLEASLKMNQELYSGNHPKVAESLNNVGMAHKDLGGTENLKGGLQYLEESLKMWQALYPGNHSDVAISLENVGGAYKALGGAENIKKGLQYQEVSLKMWQALYPGNHQDVAISLEKVGIAYEALGGVENITKGIQYQEASLKMWQTLYSGNHRDVAISLESVGIAYKALGGADNIERGLQYLEESLKMRQALYPGNHPEVAISFENVGIAYEDLGGVENIVKGLKYQEEALRMRQVLFSTNHPNVAQSLHSLGIGYEQLGDIYKALEYYKQAYGMFFVTEDYELMQAVKSRIELLEPKFFDKKDLGKLVEQINCGGGNKVGSECRWMIISRGKVDNDILILKKQIQENILNNITESVDKYGWSSGWARFDWGVKGYIAENYLARKLGELENQENNIKVAQMLCFEAMNLGIMKSSKKPYAIVESFTQENPELVKKMAVEHPEFFVDGSIVEACVRAMPNDKAFEEHILKHMKYMGMELRQERVV